MNFKNMKTVSIAQRYVDGVFKNVITVNKVEHFFDAWADASKFAKEAHKNFEADGYNGVLTTFNVPMTKAEMNYILGKK